MLPMHMPPAPQPRPDPEIERVRSIANVLDKFFVDPILGLFIPGAGDVIGTALGLYSVVLAFKRRMSPVIIARMLLNLAIDAALGLIPLLGDATDFVFKANQRNVQLMTERGATGGKATWRDWAMVVGAFALLFAVLALVVFVIVSFFRWVF
jgi:hypothetical protein